MTFLQSPGCWITYPAFSVNGKIFILGTVGKESNNISIFYLRFKLTILNFFSSIQYSFQIGLYPDMETKQLAKILIYMLKKIKCQYK